LAQQVNLLCVVVYRECSGSSLPKRIGSGVPHRTDNKQCDVLQALLLTVTALASLLGFSS
jgi:hypothetical protein